MAGEGDYSYITRKVVNYSGDGSAVYSNSEKSFGLSVSEQQKKHNSLAGLYVTLAGLSGIGCLGMYALSHSEEIIKFVQAHFGQ